MAKKQNVHVVPKGGQWAVKPAGEKPTSTHKTQQAAIEKAKPTAKKNQSEVVIHRPNGQIRDSDLYGNDPCPPRDRKR